MPLTSGPSKATISHNIREMIASGHPQNQAVAASLHNADKGKHMNKKVRHIRMEPADNGGWSVDTEHERDPKASKEMMYDYDSNREHTVHSTNEDAINHIRGKMEAHGGKKKDKGNNHLAKKAAGNMVRK